MAKVWKGVAGAVAILIVLSGFVASTASGNAAPNNEKWVESSAKFFNLFVSGPYVNGQLQASVKEGARVTYRYRVQNMTTGSFANWRRTFTWEGASPITDTNCDDVRPVNPGMTQIEPEQDAIFECTTTVRHTTLATINARFDTYWSAAVGTISTPDSATITLSTQVRPANPQHIEPIECKGTGVYIGKKREKANKQEEIFTQLYQQYVTPAGKATFEPVGGIEHRWQYNAMAYHPEEKVIYAISSRLPGRDRDYGRYSPPGHILKIDANGTVFDTGVKLTGDIRRVVNEKDNVGGGITSGTFIQVWEGGRVSGYEYFISNSSASGTKELFTVDLATGNTRRLSQIGAQLPANDFSVLHDAQGDDYPYVWGVQNPTAQNQVPMLVRYDLNLAFQGRPAKTLIPLPAEIKRDIYGAAWTFGNGNLGFSGNRNGQWFQLAITDPGSPNPGLRVVSRGPIGKSENNDGTSCTPRNPIDHADLSVDKRALPPEVRDGKVVHRWQVMVRNSGPADSSGAVLTENLPSGLTNVRVPVGSANCGLAGPEAVVSGRRLVCSVGYIEKGGSTPFVIEGEAQQPQGCLTNEASIEGNELDDRPGNNTGSAVSCGPNLDLAKRAVDAAGHPSNAHITQGADGQWHAYYAVDARNLGNTPLTYGQFEDHPAPGAGLEVVGVRWRQGDGPWTEAPRNTEARVPTWFIGRADGMLPARATHTYLLDVTLRATTPGRFDTSTALCTNNGRGHGAFNAVSSPLEVGDKRNNAACVSIERPRVPGQLTLVKNVVGGGPLARGDRWQLAVQFGPAPAQTPTLNQGATPAQGVSNPLLIPVATPFIRLMENAEQARQLNYQPGEWACTLANAQPPLNSRLPVASQPGTAIGIIQTALPDGARVRCEITNTYVPPTGGATWNKIDAQSRRLIGGANFRLDPSPSISGAASRVVEDCTAQPCRGADLDPAPGVFRVADLRQGEWHLVETRAPVGYELDATPHRLGVTAGHLAQPDGTLDVPNTPAELPAIPFTGGLGADGVRLAGFLTLTLGAVLAASFPVRLRRRS